MEIIKKGLMMTKKNILHMISPQENVSPFDVNMACDAGYDLVIPYTNVNLTDVKGLVQDAIFSRLVSVVSELPPRWMTISWFITSGKPELPRVMSNLVTS